MLNQINTHYYNSFTDKGERIRPYEEWTKEELYQEAIKLDIPGRSYMNKRSLVRSLKAKAIVQ
ncbi:hypothetical protein [Flavobacterium pectinovorum]|jgi:hypothetical protein|uniref:Rho termination factor N-terminal domain-containing protein n=1 Tax=Flavobacterium pectinovorum TaxID=29533 RepID=A0A502EAL2_9FLAO|nr:hypothetical protein [Flavobacterium pectinovorum]TPG34755.1 hypothetical protein EAH81_21960 [Flavobacterium pectinovorum]